MSARALVLSLAVVVVLALPALLAGCGMAPPAPEGSAAEVPAVALGGYSFTSASNALTHPYFTAKISTPKWVGKGYGEFQGAQARMVFSDGGKVANVKTLKATVVIAGSVHSILWLAQDTAGNIHRLRLQEPPDAAELEGVAAGQPAWFWLPRVAGLKAGGKWYGVASGVRTDQFTAVSLATTFRGMAKLLSVRAIWDMSADGRFDPKWAGADQRYDVYFSRTAHMVRAYVLSATGGFVI